MTCLLLRLSEVVQHRPRHTQRGGVGLMAASYHGDVSKAPHSSLRVYPHYIVQPWSWVMKLQNFARYIMQDTYRSV